MKEGDIPALSQLIKTLEETEAKLEKSYGEKDAESFNSVKKLMIKVQNQISKMIK